MINQYALVTVRSTSSRLPNKCFANVADKVSLVEAVIRRAKKIGCPVVLCTSEDPSDNNLEAVAAQESVFCFRGALPNKIRRWSDCFEKFDIHSGLLVDGDDPTFDYLVGGRALQILANGEADLVKASPEITPGFFTYGISRQGILKLANLVPNRETNTDVISKYLEHAKLSTAYIQPLEDEVLGHNLRLTVDYPEDLDFYLSVHQKIDYLAPGPMIVKTALAHELQKINWHRHDEFLKNQQAFNDGVQI